MSHLIAVLFSLATLSTHASVFVNGYFDANKSCPAYQSKNKKTNPDKLYVRAGQRYKIVEVNHYLNPDWMRIKVAPNYKPRWVSSHCGQANFSPEVHKAYCDNSPGLADAYVLALSWQAGFCQTYGKEAGIPECLHLKSSDYAAQHLVLHGLWPNQNTCGQSYGYCNTRPKSRHCDYSPIYFMPSVATELKQLMPSYAYGSCLERHEWNKHGSCQILSADNYFSLAMRLNKAVNESALGQYLSEHRGDRVSRQVVRQQVINAFGSSAARKVFLGCKNNTLVDVYIQLPALIPATESLSALIAKAPELKRYDGCPEQFTISDETL